MNLISLNYNTNGQINVQLPQGPQIDSYKIYLSVNIIDDTHGLTTFTLNSPVIVIPNDALTLSLTQSMLNNDQSNQMIKDMNSNNLNIIASNAIALSTVLNAQNETTNETNNEKAYMRDYMTQKVTSMSVPDVSSIKVMGSTLSKLTEMPEQVNSNMAV